MTEIPLLGIDLGGTNLKAGLVGAGGQLRDYTMMPLPRTIEELRRELEALTTSWSGGFQGIGFSCKGITDRNFDRLLFSPGDLNYLEGMSFRNLLSNDLADTPLYAENDAKNALLAEARWGKAQGCRNVAMVTLGTGVGGALLIDGKLYRGARGVAGHLGHMTVDFEGKECICGHRGCVETIFSARSIEAAFFDHIHRGLCSTLQKNATCEQIFAAAADGDPVASRVVDRACVALAATLADIVHAFDPELIVLSGQVASSGEQLLGRLRAELRRRTRFFLNEDVPLAISESPAYGGVLGAAALAMTQMEAR
jgi:glucokinase